jgi:hypothetical protein
LSQKAAPELASFLESQAAFVGGRIKQMAGPVMSRTRAAAARATVMQEAREKEAREKAEKEGKKWEELSRREKLKYLGVGRALGAFVTSPIRAGYRVAGTTAGEEVRREMARAEKEAEKIRDPRLAVAKIQALRREGRLEEGAMFLSKTIEKGGEFKKAAEKEVKLKDAQLLIKQANIMGAKLEAERIAAAFLPKAGPSEEELRGLTAEQKVERIEEYRRQWLRKAGFKDYDDLTAEEKEEWDAKNYRTITQKLIGDMKPSDIKNLGKDFWNPEKNPDIMKAIQLFWGGPQLAKAAEEFGRRFVKDYEDYAGKLSLEEQIRTNPKAVLYRAGTAAQDLGFTAPEGLSRAAIRRLIEEEERRKREEEERIRIGMRRMFGRGRRP